MRTGRDDRKLFKRLTISGKLAFESKKVVSFALDLVPMKAAIQHGHVNSALRVRKSEFVDYKRAGLPIRATQSR